MKKLLGIVVLGLLLSGNAYTSEWAVTIENNEFEKKKSIYLASDDALPNKKLSFPYEDTSSNLMIGCNGKGYYWIYFFFNKVNLKSDGFTSDGNSTAKASVKYGEKVSGLELYFGTGSNFIMIDSDYKEVMFERISEYSSIMVQFDHFSDGKRYYKYNTLNFTEAYNQNCK